MPRNLDLRARLKDRRVAVRAALGVLLAADLVAAVFVFHPLGGSTGDLARKVEAQQRELAQQLQKLERTRNVVSKVEQARKEGDQFINTYVLNRRTAYSTLIGEVNKLATDSGMKPKESAYSPPDPVEGSNTMEQLTITASYEGSYQSLTKFVNMLDKSPRFLIIDGMQAAPLANGALSVTVKLDTFIQEAQGGKS